jgi:hypothetical protein
MNLREIRAKFVELTGRDNLVEIELDGNGDIVFDAQTGQPKILRDISADYYIMAGSRWLDQQIERTLEQVDRVVDVDKGGYQVNLPAGVRAIREVFVLGTKAVRLTKVPIELFEANYGPDFSLYSGVNETPLYYAIGVLRGGRASTTALETETKLLIGPPALADITLRVRSLEFSASFEPGDDDTWFWSVVHPDALVTAAMLKMEQAYRNSAGARDHREALADIINGINRDFVRQQIVDIEAANDSWQFIESPRRRDFLDFETK